MITNEQAEEYFFNALCNGMSYTQGHGLELSWDEAQYRAARRKLQEASYTSLVCYEDVCMQLLRDGGKLTLTDVEGDDESFSIGMEEVHARVGLTPLYHLQNMIDENDDAETADAILQTVFLGEIVYG